MKLWQILAGATLAVTVTGVTHAAAPIAEATTTSIAQPAVSGSVNILQRMALPPDSVLTVTLSDASLADAPSKVLAQQVKRTEGNQAPFSFVLPYNPSDVQPNARVILSAVISSGNGNLMFVTDSFPEVINNGGNQVDLILVPVAGASAPALNQAPAVDPTQETAQ